MNKNSKTVFEEISKDAPQKKTSNIRNSLDNETLKMITSSKPVLLYHSKWGDSVMYPGKIYITESGLDTLVWTSFKEPKKSSIKLQELKHGKILSGNEGYNFLKNLTNIKHEISPEIVLVFAFTEVLCVAFEDSALCTKWKSALNLIVKGLIIQSKIEEVFENSDSICESNYTPEQYGTVFDISEPTPANESWRDIKVTFVKEDTSQTEYLIYDRTQPNLYNSVDEILLSVEKYLDVVNYNVFKMYLLDITRLEYGIRVLSLPVFKEIYPLVPNNIKFRRKNNSELRTKYKDISGTDMANQLIGLMQVYDAQDNGDALADALNLLTMQKLGISLQIHQVACEHEIYSMKKSFKKYIKVEELEENKVESEEIPDTEVKINEILSKKETNSTKSIFREVCECLVI